MFTFRQMLDAYSLTLASASKRFGIPYRTVQNWASGERVPPDYVLRMMDIILRRELEDKLASLPPIE